MNKLILDKLEGVKQRFEEVAKLISEPGIVGDMKQYVRLNKEYKELKPIISVYDEYRNILSNIKNAREILSEDKDEELKEMAKTELEELNLKIIPLEEKLKLLLLPADPEDNKNAILEIRAGTGGNEASIFAGDLQRMYSKFCEQKGWKLEVSIQHPHPHTMH